MTKKTPAPDKPKPAARSAKRRSRKDSIEAAFQRALETAIKRLETAILERALCLERLATLNVEVPQLEHTIAALRAQTSPQGTNIAPLAVAIIPQMTVTQPLPWPAAIPEALPNDLTGMGSRPVSHDEITEADSDNFPDLPDSL